MTNSSATFQGSDENFYGIISLEEVNNFDATFIGVFNFDPPFTSSLLPFSHTESDLEEFSFNLSDFNAWEFTTRRNFISNDQTFFESIEVQDIQPQGDQRSSISTTALLSSDRLPGPTDGFGVVTVLTIVQVPEPTLESIFSLLIGIGLFIRKRCGNLTK